jgi:Family of unknown function (DUF5691)
VTTQTQPQMPADIESLAAQLQRVALLGTERMEAQLPQLALPSGVLRGSQSAAAWAMQWIVQSTVIRHAGGQGARQLETIAVVPAPGQEQMDNLPSFINPAAQAAFRDCLELGVSGAALVYDFLATAQRQEKTLAPLVLPAALKFIATLTVQSRSQFNLPKLLGPRGLWLATQNPQWANLVQPLQSHDLSDPETLRTQWDIASTQERLEWIKTLRAQPHWASAQPTLITSLISSARDTDPPAEVAKYIAALAPQLSMADHDWLEDQLDAKHKPVRSAAIELLKRLPGSALAARALKYLTQDLFHCEVQQTRGLMGLIKSKPTLHFVLPEIDKVLEKTLARDGYVLKAIHHTTVDRKTIDIGPKLSLLLQCLECVPFEAFCAALNVSLQDAFAMLLEHESRDALVAAVGRSMLNHRAADESMLERILASQLLPKEIAVPLACTLSVRARESYILSGKGSYSITDLIGTFSEQEAFGPKLSQWVINGLEKSKLDAYNRSWGHGDEAALAIRLDTQTAQNFVGKARAAQTQDIDTASAQGAAFAANYWEPLLRAIELKIAYTAALHN